MLFYRRRFRLESETNASKVPNMKLAAVCGLFCPACTIYIASTEDPSRLKALSQRFGVSETEMECHGCRSEKRGLYCNKYCRMTRCAQEKGVDFCGQCSECPCAELKTFQSQMPHRIELWQSHERIKAGGFNAWYAEATEQYSCPECGTINSAYDQKCRKCNSSPSCNFVKVHGEEVARHGGRLAL